MSTRIRFGVLSTSAFALRQVIPAMQQSELTAITAIASRDLAKARHAASAHNIPKAYGSYEELLADPEIDAIYNPLPNHLHVPWSIKAAEAGKHVLCEKPLSMNVAEVRSLIEVRDRTGVRIAEAFMIRSFHQWLRLRELLDQGRIGELRSVAGVFSYFNTDSANIRNRVETGGGAVYDIGCYLIHSSRFAFGHEPTRVVATIDRDPGLGTDRLASAILEFPSGHAIFTCGTQLIPYQRIHFLGTRGRIEIEIPYNAPNDRETRLFIDSTGDLTGTGISTETFPVTDQYTAQGDAFAKATLDGTPVPVTLEDSLGNMSVIDAIFRSAVSGNWEAPQK